MKSKNYIRILFLALIATISIFLFSYSHSNSNTGEDNCDNGKCSEKKSQSEFILWESLTHNLLSASR